MADAGPSDDALRSALAWMLAEYGPQGWWPVRCEGSVGHGTHGPRGTSGYHPGDFTLPATRRGRWEVTAGAILTQNTAWSNVERALDALSTARVDRPEAILALDPERLATLIRPAGYFNQKARYLRDTAQWFAASDRRLIRGARSRAKLEAARQELLAVRGVGRETADSVLLYAYGLPTFVIDAYTRRIFERVGAVEKGLSYEALRKRFEEALAVDGWPQCARAWQEAHALIVEHAKRHHGRGSDGSLDPLHLANANRRSHRKASAG